MKIMKIRLYMLKVKEDVSNYIRNYIRKNCINVIQKKNKVDIDVSLK